MKTIKQTMKSVVACALVACGFAVTGFAGSNTKNVLYYSGSGNNAKSFAEAGAASKFVTSNHSFTMAVWMKPGDSTTASQPLFFQGSIDGCDETYHSFGLFYNGTTKQIDFRRRTAWSWNDSLKTTADYPQDGKWHFIAGVYDAEAMTRTLYIDGSMVAQTTNVPKGDSFTKTTGISFGFQKWVNGYKGYLAEASVWGVAKTENEILAMRNARPTDFTDCYAYWPFDEGGALSSARDISGNGVTVTISNTTHANLCEVTDFDETFDPGDSRITYDVLIKYPQDRVSVEVSGTEMVGGKFVADSEGTFTASGEGVFLGWAGDIPENQRMNQTVTITVDESKVIVPVFAYDWVYDSTAKTISDGYWTLNVTVKDSEATIAGVNTATFRSASDIPLMQILDLRKRVSDSNGTTYSIVTLGSNAFKNNVILEEVGLPNTLKTIAQSGWWGNDGVFWGCASLKKVTPFLPDSVEFVGIASFRGCTALEGDLVMNRDGRPFTFDKAGGSATFEGTKITSVWLGAGVTNIVVSAFNGCTALTNVTWTGEMMEVGSCAFNGCTALQKVTPFDFLSTSVMGDRAFNNCTTLEGELSLGLKCNFRNTDGTYYGAEFGNTKISSITLGNGVTNLVMNFFTGCKSVTEVRFLGCPQQIVGSAFNGWTPYQACIYVPFAGTGWESYSCYTPWRDLGDDIKAKFTEAHPGARHPIGLTTAPKDTSIPLPANQWLCNLKEPGMKLIFR